MKKRIIEIIKENCYDMPDDSEIVYSKHIYEDYAIDSISFINIIVEIEEAFGISIPDEYLDMDMLGTIDDICNVVQLSKNNA